MRIINLPSDSQLLDALDKVMRRRTAKVVISAKFFKATSYTEYRFGEASKEGALRTALRVFLQKRKAWPADIFDDEARAALPSSTEPEAAGRTQP